MQYPLMLVLSQVYRYGLSFLGSVGRDASNASSMVAPAGYSELIA